MRSVAQGGGIYAIYGPNQGVYVGSAVRFQKRWADHISLLNRGVHHSPHLQHAYNKYGLESLSFVVLEAISDMSTLYAVEQMYLDRLFAETPRHRIYNATRHADGSTGRTATPETRAKLSAMRKGKPKSEETRQRIAEGRRGIEFSDTHRDNNAFAKSGGCIYTLISPEGEQYPNIVNLTRFARDHGLCAKGLAAIVRGRLRTHRGWTLRRQEDLNV